MPTNVKSQLIFLLAIFQSSYPQRRIKDGFEVTSDKRYMVDLMRGDARGKQLIKVALYGGDLCSAVDVFWWRLMYDETSCYLRAKPSSTKEKVYFLNAPSAPVKYEFWTCGGALVTPTFIVTSAACVRDVRYLYAIAGYRKFVDYTQLDTDDCLKNKKKKVVMICVPKNYKFAYNKTENWAGIDIAVVQVETPFNLNDKGFEQHCSYIPELVAINYEAKYQQDGTDAMALGWGHAEEYRKDKDNTNMNQQTLHYAPTKILAKNTCLKYFEGNPNMQPFISKYMICTLERGNLNDNGEIIARSRPDVEGCITNIQKLAGVKGEMCEPSTDLAYDANGDLVMLDDIRRDDYLSVLEETRRRPAKRPLKSKSTKHKNPRQQSPRRQGHDQAVVTEPAADLGPEDSPDTLPGICQNDHGGPLVTWVGTHEVLIGVATMFMLDQKLKCTGPYLFTSTQCNSAFLDCVITMSERIDKNETRRINPRCETMKEQGFDVVSRRISWFGHPDGPAEDEVILERHQVPMNSFNTKG